ncbi:BON domain-containing protein [Marinibacterium profundimaris]|uniref:BON domain-containing protein n=1 Tax=Marinibacterium profundimaris TaxID=1679460 RepID=A0A225NBU4_9RHOB|nr:BON domain-containing protein [Marinibacterium profundimaris]OWU68114.1 hypothetical protein ATO3_24800 [Marinibacterium profundimaris]
MIRKGLKATSSPDRVISYLAEPSRSKGRGGVRQPVRPDLPVLPPEDAPEDTVLAQRVRESLNGDGRLEVGSIGVGARDGVIVLQGRVPREFQRSLANALAEKVPGTLNVENQIMVVGE